MITIWKFPLDFASGNERIVKIPEGARVLSAGVQPGPVFVIWAVVDPDAYLRDRVFSKHNTGGFSNGPAPEAKFVSTVFVGPDVWHIFDLGEVPLPGGKI